jgi:hypothetical protein
MTAVQWLMDKLSYDNGLGLRYPSHSEMADLSEYFKQAKEMENQEKMEAFIEGYKQRAEASNLIFDNSSRMYAIYLYNETFKK